MTEQSKLITAISIATVLIFGGLIFAITHAPSDVVTPTGKVTFNDARSIATGKLDSKVVVRMYSDFQCPACKAAEAAVRSTIQAYSDRVEFIWKDFPLLTVHANARNAANAARCANDQAKFWDFHNRLYDNQEVWAPLADPKARFVQLARDAGLNVDQFTSCYDSRKFDDQIMSEENEGLANGVDSTPTFYINNAPVQVRSEDQWRQALDAALADAAKSTVSTSTIPLPAASSTK